MAIPRYTSAPAPRTGPSGEAPVKTSEKSVLVVDPDESVQALFRHALELQGHEVRAVNGLEEAYHAIFTKTPDLCIIESHLPDGRGLSLVGHAHQTYGCEVILVTSVPHLDLTTEAVRAGASDVIEKPFDVNRLLFAVEAILR